MLDARAMAVGEQVTPTEFRALHCPHAIERTLLRSVAIPPTIHGWDSRSFRTVSDEVGMCESLMRTPGF